MGQGSKAKYSAVAVDPVKYEILRRRLYSILEEGRIAIRMVSGSPVVVEGGETCVGMFSPKGETLFIATGILAHATGSRGAVIYAMENFYEDPGFQDGDQLFMNDPYIAGLHTPDQMMLKPIFYKGEHIAWVSSVMHTAEVGAAEPGGMSTVATEIYHEGMRVAGLKIVERGRLRKDIFDTLVGMVRDPVLVGLDVKARIASNNVCAKRILEVVDNFGLDFYKAAIEKMLTDTEGQARARLLNLPDGTWRARKYGDSSGLKEEPMKIMCTMTKERDTLTFDFAGTSPQAKGSYNIPGQATRCTIDAVVLCTLFPDLPWNNGLIAPMKYILPEGSVVNCKYPVAVGNAVTTYMLTTGAVAHACINRMLFAGGMTDYITSGWRSFGAGLLSFFGPSQYGSPVAGAIIESPGCGSGSTARRAGVDAGGTYSSTSANIPDAEAIEARVPFMYLAKYIATDSGGAGKFRGGNGAAMIYDLHGTKNFQLGRRGCGKRIASSLGMFGGYPGATQPGMIVFDSNVGEEFKQSKYPTTMEEALKLKGDMVDDPPPSLAVREVDEGTVCVNTYAGGGGYGDPVEADPNQVAQDVRNEMVSWETAERLYGVILDPETCEVKWQETSFKRDAIRQERIRGGKRLS